MSQAASSTGVIIDVVSDVVCPWCFIGKRRLERALTLAPEIPVQVRWNPFFLNPWVPPEGISREEYLRTKFGSIERYAHISQRLTAAGAEEGIPFAFEKMTRQPNTTDCHRLIGWARENDASSQVKERLMQLYFIEGADLSDQEVLAHAAADCGMDQVQVRSRLGTDEDVGEVSAAAKAASDAGIDGVPCFIFNGKFAVSGAQAPEYLVQALKRAEAERGEPASAAAQ